ncbi:MAG: biopolymer transporter ExbD [Planctomycetes bacterium]|nr:biopolymer transporter ExbD [Planctomycetota bacterium]
MSLRRRHGPSNALLFLTVLPIAPLVDISLVLVVFLIAVMQADAQRALPVALPKAGTAAATVGASFAVSIDRSGVVRVDGRSVTPAELSASAKGRAQATIRADAKVDHGTVVGVVDALRKAGVDKIFYAATPGVVEW